MAATLNMGAEAIRLERNHLPLLLELYTSGAVAADAATAGDLEALEAGSVVVDGALHPMAAAMFEIVSAPALVVSAERMRLGEVAATTIWATPAGMVVASRLEEARYELQLASSSQLVFRLFQAIQLRPLPSGPGFSVTVSAQSMVTAEALLDDADLNAAMATLEGEGADAAQVATRALAQRVASWRIHSVWSGEGGPASAQAAGIDCGRRGHVLVTVAAQEPILTMSSARFKDVLRAVRMTLPG